MTEQQAPRGQEPYLSPLRVQRARARDISVGATPQKWVTAKVTRVTGNVRVDAGPAAAEGINACL